jgi:hypothetical protein
MLDTYTKRQTNTLTVRQLADALDDTHVQALADIASGLVRSLRPNRDSAVQLTDAAGTAWTITETVQRLASADLVERVKGSTGWRLTPAGAEILKRHAGGAR